MWLSTLPLHPYVEEDEQAQPPQEEEGQPRQEAELRARLTPGLGLVVLTIAVADPAEAWSDLGFAVSAGVCFVGQVAFALGFDGGGRGLRAWSVGAVDGIEGCEPVAGASAAGSTSAAAAAVHANGVVGLDHVVITTPDHDRTLAAFKEAGYDLRRVRETDTYGTPMRQGFFKHGSVVLEVIGPAAPNGAKPARLWGLAFTVADLDETAAFLGQRLHPAKDAVQPGRRIATLDKTAGPTVPLAFMSAGPTAV
jgi:hypothetical protein